MLHRVNAPRSHTHDTRARRTATAYVLLRARTIYMRPANAFVRYIFMPEMADTVGYWM